MEIEGMIIRDLGQFDGVSKAGNPWKKHEWVLETTGQYPRKVKFTVFGDKTNTLTFELGKSYVIQVDVESREYNERWYTDLTAYNCRLLDVAPGANQVNNPPVSNGPVYQNPALKQPVSPDPFGSSSTDFIQGDSQEDLPF